MAEQGKMKDVSVADGGNRIVTEAAAWKGTPYQLNGAGAIKGVGGDCSGTTQRIYQGAHCPYAYQTANHFAVYALNSGLFRELGAGDQKQDGDILLWPNHMAIYSSFASDLKNATTERTTAQGKKWIQKNDMWTASHPNGPAYAPAEMRYWRPDAPRVFRYQK